MKELLILIHQLLEKYRAVIMPSGILAVAENRSNEAWEYAVAFNPETGDTVHLRLFFPVVLESRDKAIELVSSTKDSKITRVSSLTTKELVAVFDYENATALTLKDNVPSPITADRVDVITGVLIVLCQAIHDQRGKNWATVITGPWDETKPD